MLLSFNLYPLHSSGWKTFSDSLKLCFSKRPFQQPQMPDQCKIRQAFYIFLSFFLHMKPSLLSNLFWSVFSLFFASAKAHQSLTVSFFLACWTTFPAFQLQNLHILSGRKNLWKWDTGLAYNPCPSFFFLLLALDLIALYLSLFVCYNACIPSKMN